MSLHNSKLLLTIAAICLSFASYGQNDKKQAMQSLVDELATKFNDHYAPREWKKSEYGLDFEFEKTQILSQIETNPSVSAYQKLLKKMLSATKDYHVSISFTSTGYSMLPFLISSIDGKYYINYIDRSQLPLQRFPFQVGDEITSIGGESIADIANKLASETYQNRERTDASLTAMSITMRSGRKVQDLPSGPTTVVGQGILGQEIVAEVIWIHEQDQMVYPFREDSVPDTSSLATTNFGFSPRQLPMDLAIQSGDVQQIWSKVSANLQRNYSVAHLASHQKQNKKAGSPQNIGHREGFLPKLDGRRIWESNPDGEFYAYINENESRQRIGFIRIHSFMPTSEKISSITEAAEQLKAILAIMNQNADMLVIDQTSNPGGSLFYLYAISSMLTDRPLQTPKERIALDSAMVWDAKLQLKGLNSILSIINSLGISFKGEIHGYEIDTQFLYFMKDYYTFIISQWKEGKTLTEPYHIYGTDSIIPNSQVNYTGPILMLINELDFSCGDFFPAIMQDNQRVTLMGENTAGAGGYVLSYRTMNNLGLLGYSMTGSIAIRPNGNPIENLGVQPDLEYKLTPGDLITGYSLYKNEIMSQINKTLNKEQS